MAGVAVSMLPDAAEAALAALRGCGASVQALDPTPNGPRLRARVSGVDGPTMHSALLDAGVGHALVWATDGSLEAFSNAGDMTLHAAGYEWVTCRPSMCATGVWADLLPDHASPMLPTLQSTGQMDPRAEQDLWVAAAASVHGAAMEAFSVHGVERMPI